MSEQRKSVERPDQVLEMSRGKIEVVNIAGGAVGRATFEPGWNWSEHEKPAVGATGEFCAVPHFVYLEAGQLHVVMEDGSEFDLHRGDVAVLPSGHRGWVVGDEPAVMLDFAGVAKPV